MNNRGKRIASIILVGVLSIGMTQTAHATSIEDAKQKANELEQQKEAAEAEKSNLSAQLTAIIGEMEATREEMKAKEAEITKTEQDLIMAKATEDDQYKAMKKRIKYMYENGSNEFIEIMLESKTISDFLNKAEYISQISSYDRKMLVEFQKVVKEVEAQEKLMKEEYEELGKIQDNLAAKQAEVEALVGAKDQELAVLEKELGDNAAVLEKLIAEAKAAEERQRQAASGGTWAGSGSGAVAGPPVISGNGFFTHPCPGMTYQSSYFGEIREFEVGGHRGHDYAAPTGTPTYAAADGTVLIAGWSDSAGNWVVINHGNGLTTKYMHHSALTVYPGQAVSKGQQIGLVGSTGQSTGPHLHFQTEEYGVAVSPDKYL